MTTEKEKTLAVVDGETLMDMRLPPTRFCVDTLLPQGVSILGGAPKIGKSWLVLDLCIRIAKGESLWDLPTHKGTTLYLCLEDPLRRVQERLNCITDEVPSNVFFATAAGSLADGLCEQIIRFVAEHPDTVLIVIDTFQVIREVADSSYAVDYGEVRKLKELVDKLNLSLLLVHHLRKEGDSDPLKMLSGTTGISGAVDEVFVLDQSKRNATGATLICTGRDIAYRELELNFSKETFVWERISDSLDDPMLKLPKEMVSLVEFMKQEQFYYGSNTAFSERYNSFSGESASPKALKQMMNRWRYALEEQGVFFESHRSNGQRLLRISFSGGDESAVSDGEIPVCHPCVPSVPCVPASPA